jgi:Kef-type K+ transport system membrane component KefB
MHLPAPGDAAYIPLSMLLVFGCAKLLAELFERLHQPGIVGEILAGVLIGPSVLGWIAPDDFLAALANLGAMFLLFRVGLDVKASELLRVGGIAALVGILGVVVPFLAGWAIMLSWHSGQTEAIFVGAAMVATSVGITAQVLAAKGLLQERASKIILAAAVIDDVLGLLVLAVVSSLAEGNVNIPSLLLTAALAVAFTVILAKWGTASMSRIVPGVGARLRVGEAQFAISMVLLFALSLLAVFIGVAAIVGAFLAGLALAESVRPRVKELAQGVTELLVPFFLAGIGLHVNLRVLGEKPLVILAMVVMLAAIAAKFVGCGIAAATLGKVDALRIGVGMIPRGEVGMVVAQLGLTLGVIKEDIYSIVVFMAVATTLVAPPLIKLAYAGARPTEREEVARIG